MPLELLFFALIETGTSIDDSSLADTGISANGVFINIGVALIGILDIPPESPPPTVVTVFVTLTVTDLECTLAIALAKPCTAPVPLTLAEIVTDLDLAV